MLPTLEAEGSENETEPAPEKGQAVTAELPATARDLTPPGAARRRPNSGDSTATPQAYDLGSGRLTAAPEVATHPSMGTE